MFGKSGGQGEALTHSRTSGATVLGVQGWIAYVVVSIDINLSLSVLKIEIENLKTLFCVGTLSQENHVKTDDFD